MRVQEVDEFMNKQRSRARYCHWQRATAGRVDGNGRAAAIGSHFRHGEGFAKISELEEKSARRLGSGPHNGSFRAV